MKTLTIFICIFCLCEQLFAKTDDKSVIGDLVVSSNIKNASIRLNGESTEFATPAYIPDLPVGDYVIELIDQYGKLVSEEFRVEAGQIKTVKLNFDLGRLYIMSNISADSIYINNQVVRLRIRPDSLAMVNKLVKGDYALYVVDNIYGVPVQDKIFLQADIDTISLRAELTDLMINSNVDNARVFLNGRGTGRLIPAVFSELPAGVYDIMLVKGKKRVVKTVQLKPDMANQVEVLFEKSNLWKYISLGTGLVGASTLTYFLTRDEAEKDKTGIESMPGPSGD